MHRRAMLAASAAAATASALPAAAQDRKGVSLPALVTEEFRIPAPGALGIELYVRNKRAADHTRFSPETTLVYVHGATYPASTAFDLKLDGLSWMDFIAARGFDVWLLDLRGYGMSTALPELAQPANANPPPVRTAVAADDVGRVVDFVRARRQIARVNLMGWSWGTSIMGMLAGQQPDKVERLVLYAPQWLRMPPATTPPAPAAAWRDVTRATAHQRWVREVPADRLPGMIPAGWFDAWADATWATNQRVPGVEPPTLRAPNGVLADSAETYGTGKPLYDPKKITVPTLLVVAAWDQDTPVYMAEHLVRELTNAPMRRLSVLAEGTHTVVMERNRMALFHEVQGFLEAPPLA